MFTLYMLLVAFALLVVAGFHHTEKVLIRIEEELKRMNANLSAIERRELLRDDSKILVDKDVFMAVPVDIMAAAAIRVGIERAEAAAKAATEHTKP